MSLINAVSCLLLVLLSCTSAEKHEGAQMSKVVGLLKKFRGEVIAEGQKESADFKEYSDFCAKETDEKEYQTGRSKKSIERMKSEVDALTNDIKLLEGEIKDLTNETDSLKKELEKAIAVRAGEATAYSAKAKEMTDSIEALYKAEKAVKAGTGDFVAMAQVKATASKVLSAEHKELIDALGGPKTSSPDIIDTLRDLKREFIQNKRDLDTEEQTAKYSFEKVEQDMTNRLKYATEDTEEKTASQLAKKVKKAQLDKDLKDEKKTLSSDEAFLKELKAGCADKAKIADQRTTKRESELKSLASIIEELSK
eukprot:TRINITY_DN96713_c0_g1_i1.p1 TRINITY_DN96713_c0_g1~~TRINITY_DN96713_c0_g1_i1.p1  ORF type:complete len:310 (+),score=96.26 TRINITY_DN96713_c0_g1_i1:89-1018(+)